MVHVAAVGLDGEAVGEVGDRGVGWGRLDPADAAGGLECLAHGATVARDRPRHQRPECRRPSILRQGNMKALLALLWAPTRGTDHASRDHHRSIPRPRTSHRPGPRRERPRSHRREVVPGARRPGRRRPGGGGGRALRPHHRRGGAGRRRQHPAPRRAGAPAVELGGLTLLVNNASTLGPSPQPALADYPLDALEEVYRVNVVAPLALVQQALPLLRATGGAIVNVTSDAAVEGYEGWGGYGSSKAALDQLTNVLAAEEPEPAGLLVRPRRHAHPDAPGRLPRRGHLRPARARDRRCPRSSACSTQRPPSGRYRAADLLEGAAEPP